MDFLFSRRCRNSYYYCYYYFYYYFYYLLQSIDWLSPTTEKSKKFTEIQS